MTYRFTSGADQDLSVALQYYEEAQEGLGARFLDDLEEAIRRVVSMPFAWKPLSPRTRRCLFHRFPFAIIYQVRGEEIVIVAVADLRRDPARLELLK